MFSVAPTRFETTLELQPTRLLLQQLSHKEIELRGDKTQKHAIVAYLLSSLMKNVDEFNKIKPHETHYDDLNDLMQLLQNLIDTIFDVYQHDRETLELKRNHNKDLARGGAGVTSLATAGMLVTGVMTGPLGLSVAAAAFLGSTAYLWNTNADADTIVLVHELHAEIVRTHETLKRIASNNHGCKKK